jgi:hypothetical protein
VRERGGKERGEPEEVEEAICGASEGGGDFTVRLLPKKEIVAGFEDTSFTGTDGSAGFEKTGTDC